MDKHNQRKADNTMKKLNKRKSTLDILQRGDNIIIHYNPDIINSGRAVKVSLKKVTVVEKYNNHLIIFDKLTNRRDSVNYHSVLCGEICVKRIKQKN